MVGSSQAFLEYNTVSVMKNILAIEDHLIHLKGGYNTEEASCLMKHALKLEEQSDEGISHATDVGDRRKTNVFHALQEGAQKLRQRFKARASPEQLIKEIRALRREAEALDPSFNLEKCATCGGGDAEDDTALAELEEIASHEAEHPPDPSYDEVEEGMGRYVLSRLARDADIEPPTLSIREDCNDPNKAIYSSGNIEVCKGGVNLHVLSHEFQHHKQLLEGRSFDEDEAENFAKALHDPKNHKVLNSKNAEFTLRDKKKMPRFGSGRMKQLGKIVAVSVVSNSGVKVINDYVDAHYATGLMGQPYSLFIDIGGALVLSAVALSTKTKPDTSLFEAIAVGGLVSDLVNRKLLPMAGLAAASANAPRYVQPTAVFPSQQTQMTNVGNLFGG